MEADHRSSSAEKMVQVALKWAFPLAQVTGVLGVRALQQFWSQATEQTLAHLGLATSKK